MITVFVILYLSSYTGVSSTPTDDTNFEDPSYQSRKYAINTGQYIRREFKFIPEKESWQQKFAETISKAVEEETKEADYSPSGQDDVVHKEISENPTDNEQPLPRTFISPEAEPQVYVSKGDSGCTNDTTTLKPANFEFKTGIMHVPPHPQEQQYSNNEKGEILIHRPAPIIVNRPPTKVLVKHPPLIVKPAPVIFHRPPSVIVRQVFVTPKPESMRMQPVYVKIIKPAPEKIYIKEQISYGDNQANGDYSSKQRYYPSQYNF